VAFSYMARERHFAQSREQGPVWEEPEQALEEQGLALEEQGLALEEQELTWVAQGLALVVFPSV
jgi:hypothetical protein